MPQRLLRLRTFRAAAAQLLTALQAHVCGRLHGSALGAVLQDIQVCFLRCWQSSVRLQASILQTLHMLSLCMCCRQPRTCMLRKL